MDYELGAATPSAAYRLAVEAGRMPGPDVYRGSVIFEVIQKHLRHETAHPIREA